MLLPPRVNRRNGSLDALKDTVPIPRRRPLPAKLSSLTLAAKKAGASSTHYWDSFHLSLIPRRRRGGEREEKVVKHNTAVSVRVCASVFECECVGVG